MRFRDPESALRWAYELSTRPVMGRMHIFNTRGYRDPDVRPSLPSSELTIWERHAQAASLIGRVERLGNPMAPFAAMMYGSGTTPAGAAALTHWLASTMDASEAACELLLVQYITGRGSIRQLRAELKCRNATVSRVRRAAFDALDSLRVRLLAAIDGQEDC